MKDKYDTGDRFIILAGDNYYPTGADDINTSSPTLEKAREIKVELKKTDDWVEIFDLKLWRVVI